MDDVERLSHDALVAQLERGPEALQAPARGVRVADGEPLVAVEQPGRGATWALSHWNQLRLQYTHTESNHVLDLANDDAIYLQWSWIIGSHSHGWQQR